MTKEKEELYKLIIHSYDEYIKIMGRGNFQLEWELREEIAEAKGQLEDFEAKEKHALGKHPV